MVAAGIAEIIPILRDTRNKPWAQGGARSRERPPTAYSVPKTCKTLRSGSSSRLVKGKGPWVVLSVEFADSEFPLSSLTAFWCPLKVLGHVPSTASPTAHWRPC